MKRALLMALLACGCGTSSSDAPAASPEDQLPIAPAQPAPEAADTAAAEPVAEPEPPPEPEEPARDPNAALPCPPEEEWPEGMACVLGGTFTLGDERGRPDEKEPGEVYVDTFYMDVHEATNADFERCIDAGECDRPIPFRHFMSDEQPMVAVSWFDAVDACRMDGKRLPTEAEWERAASGPDHTRYPWGDEPLGCERAIVKDERGEGCGTLRTARVGSMEPGWFGLYDMAGNVHEWVYDHYSECLRGCEHECGDACFGRNPLGPCNGEGRCEGHPLRSVRGGSWYWPLERARTTARRGSGAPNRGPHRFGYRCARDLTVPSEGPAPEHPAGAAARLSEAPEVAPE